MGPIRGGAAALAILAALPAVAPRPMSERCFRLHHRSGAFGLINGSTNGGDFLSVGARYRF